jgi:hypothetical protein
MSLDVDTLYDLLPAVHRVRDAQQGEPLRALLGVIARELGALEQDLDQLYDDQFIETCAEWVAPYIGGLIGYRPLHGVAPRIASPRADVANTIAFRRRKGTALMLEELAHSVTDWPARVVEFFEQLTTTQYMNHIRLYAPATAAVRSQAVMSGVDGSFNRVAHTAEMRRPESGTGRYNIPNIGIFLWRLQPYRLRALPLVTDPGDATGRRLRVNPLGADLALFRRPTTEPGIEHLAEPVNVPDPLRVREFARQVRAATATDAAVLESDDYGAGKSVVISRNGVDEPLRTAGPAPAGDPQAKLVVRIADLRDVFDGGGNFTGWAHEDDIRDHQIALDPERGRVLLGAARVADHASSPFLATFHYGRARDIGGGDYLRQPADVADAAAPQLSASASQALQPLLDQLAAPGGRLLIDDSLTYAETPTFKAPAITDPENPSVVVGAAPGSRPLILASGALPLEIAANGALLLDGLVFAGGALHLPAAADNEPRTLVLRDCTLVPGLALDPHGDPASPSAPSLIIEHPFTKLRLERCIVGPLHVAANSDTTVEMVDCIVDAAPSAGFAYAADDTGAAGAEVTLEQCTVIGELHTELLRLASNCIFTNTVRAVRRQQGCLRFSFVPDGSITPRRHKCQPDAAHPHVLPEFTSTRFADPGYCQLRLATARVIREGADDGGEMGVMHALFQPQRETNLRIRLDEYLRFGLHAGLFYVT